MAEMRFTCPQCSQDITCDELWGGHQIQCPTCQAEISVPQPQAQGPAAGNPLVPKPPGATRLSAGRTQVARSEGALSAPVRKLVAAPPKKKNKIVSILTTVVVLAALGVGGYFGWGWVREHQNKLNAERRKVEQNSDGGELGHIANLNNVLDATEPGGRGLGGLKGGSGTGPGQRDAAAPRAIPVPAGAGASPNGQPGATATPALELQLPVIPAIWTLDLPSARIPEGRVNGSIGGTNFVAETISVTATPAAQVFRLTQGNLNSPDRELLIYLHVKSGESLSGKSWNVASTDARSADVPTIKKRWKTNPRYAPSSKDFYSGYAMKLEFGQLTNNVIAGKIYVGFPDTEQSVVAGVFNATANLTVSPATPGASPVAAPAANPGPVIDKAAIDKRYGTMKR
jgi:hypothetical protein